MYKHFQFQCMQWTHIDLIVNARLRPTSSNNSAPVRLQNHNPSKLYAQQANPKTQSSLLVYGFTPHLLNALHADALNPPPPVIGKHHSRGSWKSLKYLL